ncbi:MAG: hypothetical protein EBQ92_13470 [Proteobacteria bacterium]|nr:hypothetical protein [Pseudomonadota bacterium]
MNRFSLQILSSAFIFSALLTAETSAKSSAVQFETEKENNRARKNYVERFIKFTQDQNVSGKAKDPNGKVVQGGQKTQFNRDDGNSFQSALTYHDASYATPDEQAKQQNPNDPKAQNRQLYPFISSHGGISAGGGSSQLERAVYEKHTEYSKQDEDPEQQKKRDKEKGVRYFSIFKQETKEIKPDPKNPDQPESVTRVSLRPEVQEQIEQVGLEAFKTVESSAKDADAQNDAKAMGNLTFYREAIARASKALWDSTLSNLSQRRIFKNGEGSLAESAATCEAWAQGENQEIENKIKDPQEKQAKLDALKEKVQKCNQMAQVPWSAVDPKIEQDPKGNGTQLKENGPNFEDKYARDLRNQLEVMDKVGVNPDQLKSNWRYSEEEFQNEVVTGIDDSGQVNTTTMSNAQQIEEYNAALDESLESLKQLKAGVPDLQIDEEAIQAKKIQVGQQNILEINKVPDQMMEELGGKSTVAPAARSYSELLQEQNAGNTPAP